MHTLTLNPIDTLHETRGLMRPLRKPGQMRETQVSWRGRETGDGAELSAMLSMVFTIPPVHIQHCAILGRIQHPASVINVEIGYLAYFEGRRDSVSRSVSRHNTTLPETRHDLKRARAVPNSGAKPGKFPKVLDDDDGDDIGHVKVNTRCKVSGYGL